MKRFRIDSATESVYEYSENQQAYLFIGKTSGQDRAKWLYEYMYDLPPNYMTQDQRNAIKSMIE